MAKRKKKEAIEEGQALEGYRCSCGYVTDNVNKWRGHLLTGKRMEPGQHDSLGRVNMITGEVIMGPYDQRSKEQKQATRFAQHGDDSRATRDVVGSATSLDFIPRKMTCTFTPIMQAGLAAALGPRSVFRWREDMPLENFLDTIIYNYFMDYGVQLAAYIVDDALLEEQPDELAEPLDEEPSEEPENVVDVDGNGYKEIFDILQEV